MECDVGGAEGGPAEVAVGAAPARDTGSLVQLRYCGGAVAPVCFASRNAASLATTTAPSA